MSRQPQSPAQRERQERREQSGRYANMVPCYAGCGRRVNPSGDFCSHQLTDRVDAEGVPFGDIGLLLCPPCAKACVGQTTVRAFIAYVRTHDPALADRLVAAAR
ncbi:MAG: hypothetical protein H3C62_00775 [Gemmatimonadaceae bacterium]|nr:hypothetical protein [Gemmatimonadaceae bacterium]